ncbi:MAG: hypothetical protein XE06_1200, partial [Anaerolineaceae bacterium 46_22]
MDMIRLKSSGCYNTSMHKSILVPGLLLVLSLASCTTVGTPDSVAILESQEKEGADFVEELASPTLNQTPTQIPTAVPTATATPGPSPTPAPATYFYFEEGVNPLTGLSVSDPSVLNRRPVMIKVSNWPREGRPHAGLTSADLVFEYFIGYQMNRFLAVYYGEDAGVVGPVRSGRLVDAQLAQLYQGLLAYGNADPQVDEVLFEVLGERSLTFNALPCPPMCGESTHSATGVFADSGALTAYARENGIDNSPPDLRGMYFQSEPPVGDASGLKLRVEYANFSIMEWRYDPEIGNYQLWEEFDREGVLEMGLMTDRNNDKAVAFENVIVMYAEYLEYAPSLHDIVLQGAQGYQPALLFRDGRVNYATWRAPETERPIVFETPDGEPLPLKP